MHEAILAFVIWALCGALFLVIGIGCFFAKKPVGFWANINETPDIADVRGYNRAVGKLWIVFAALFTLLGLPLLVNPDSAAVILSIVGVMLEVIGVMIVYIHIERKYTK